MVSWGGDLFGSVDIPGGCADQPVELVDAHAEAASAVVL